MPLTLEIRNRLVVVVLADVGPAFCQGSLRGFAVLQQEHTAAAMRETAEQREQTDGWKQMHEQHPHGTQAGARAFDAARAGMARVVFHRDGDPGGERMPRVWAVGSFAPPRTPSPFPPPRPAGGRNN